MNYKDNINYRHSLEQKVFEKKKLTSAEKTWLRSNPRFNEKYSFPCLQRDIIDIPRNHEAILRVSVLSNQDKTKIYRPVISVVGKGKIIVENELFNSSMTNCTSKTTSILIPLFDENRPTISMRVISELGLISIAYQCEYYNNRMKLCVREISDGADLSYGMKRCDVSNNEFVYYCKNPSVSDDSFDSYVFSIKT